MPRTTAEIKRQPSDFQVTELLQPSLSGDGEHAWLWIEKTGANTEWVARQLARHAGTTARDVGYSGLKDRHAVTRQWFSVRASASVDWAGCDIEGVDILSAGRHRRKLRRGTHRGNRFRIALRGPDLADDQGDIEARLVEILAEGVPNRFGAQRFGRAGANVELARDWCAGRRLPRDKRSIAISAARSLIFNDILDKRVAVGSWNTIVAGEMANLDGTASVFPVETPDTELQARCQAFDIHPTGTLWGIGAPLASGEVAALEQEVAAGHAAFVAGLERGGVEASSRPLRLVVRGLSWQFGDAVLWLEFELGKGGYATTVLGELVDID